MNPALSYIDPSQVAAAKVLAGVTPVSVGGHAIGGTIAVDSQRPIFATPAASQTVASDVDGRALPITKGASSLPILVKGYAGAYDRSNGQGFGGNVGATVATETLSVSYAGAYARSDNYKAGGAFKNFGLSSAITRVLPSKEVGSTTYRTTNHQLTFAWTNENHLIEIKSGLQLVPNQLYPNQRMDMLKNTAYNLNARYFSQFGWGDVDARVYNQTVNHYMDFGADKLFYYGALRGTNGVTYPVPGMPMYTKTRTTGAALTSRASCNGRRKPASNGIALRQANRCRTPSWRA